MKPARIIVTTIVSTIVLLLSATAVWAEESVYTHAGRIVAVGDLHGDYDQYLKILKANQLVDDKLRWDAGDTHFVQLGDVADRGPDSLKIIQHLKKLKKQAKKRGGQVHVLIGNHEAMNVQGDLRYVHPGEYAALVDRGSKKNQQRYLDAVFKAMLANQPELEADKPNVMKMLGDRFPVGYVEHRSLWEPGRELANWYASNNAVIQINDTIFLHGGLDPHKESYQSLQEINETIRAELSPKGVAALSIDPSGPLWYRGLSVHPAETELEPLKRLLEFYGAKRMMVAHTPTHGAIMSRFEGRVILADVGISAHYGSSLANVLIEDDKLYAIHRGKKFELQIDDLKPYLEKLVTLEPEGSRLARYVDSLSRAAMAPKDNASTGQRVSP